VEREVIGGLSIVGVINIKFFYHILSSSVLLLYVAYFLVWTCIGLGAEYVPHKWRQHLQQRLDLFIILLTVLILGLIVVGPDVQMFR
jgi:SNF family Na+-dependent transporter